MKTKLTCDETNIDDFTIILIEEIIESHNFNIDFENSFYLVDIIITRDGYYNLKKDDYILTIHFYNNGYRVLYDNCYNNSIKISQYNFFSKNYSKNDIIMLYKNHIRLNKLKELELTF